MSHPPDVKEIFRIATSLGDRSERANYLKSVCGGDGELRDHLEALLAAHESAGEFLECGAPVHELDHEAHAVNARLGSTIG